MPEILAEKLNEIVKIKEIEINDLQISQLLSVLDTLLIAYDLDEHLNDNREVTRFCEGVCKVAHNCQIKTFDQLCVIVMLMFFRKFQYEVYERDVMVIGKVSRHYLDFLASCTAMEMYEQTHINLANNYNCKIYDLTFLNYYNCALNCYNFGKEMKGIKCKELFNIDSNDDFVERFKDIVKSVEIYGK